MLKTYLAMELYLPERPTVNRITGRFMKGHVPANKGKKWGEYMSKRSQRRSAKGWRNLDIHRNKNGRPDNAGRCRKQVVAVRDDGTFTVFGYVGSAAKAIKRNEKHRWERRKVDVKVAGEWHVFDSVSEAAKFIGCQQNNLSTALNKERETYKGYEIRYHISDNPNQPDLDAVLAEIEERNRQPYECSRPI